MDKLFDIENLRCSYNVMDPMPKVVLDIRKLSIPRGKIVFIVGESGIGKSTILEVLGMMNNTIVPGDDLKFKFYHDNGDEVDLYDMWKRNNDDELSSFRLKHFNFIFQSTNLMRNFTAYENIAITRLLQGYSLQESFEKAEKTLDDLGIKGIGRQRNAQELSGGQQQRIAFARAILPDFSVLFGDEPTGNLDGDNAMLAMRTLMDKLSEKQGSSAIIVSHDMHLAVSFSDVIVKVRKQNGHGYVDEMSCFIPVNGRAEWTNGTDSFGSSDFEQYLRARI